MTHPWHPIPGGLTAPAGFLAAGITAGLKPSGKPDLFTRLIRINEYKRRQAPVGPRVTHRAFGRDWRYPITSKFKD